LGQHAVAIVTSLSVSTILRTVWDDLGELSVRLRSPAIIGFAMVVLFEIVGTVPEISGNGLLSEAFNLMSIVAILPFEIAVYRLLILDEATSGYHFALSTVRFQRMLGWTVALWALANVPTWLPDAITLPGVIVQAVISIIAIIISIVIMLRLSILLPAIAVDAPGASVRNILADTRGHSWLILKVYLTILLPTVLIIVAAVVLAWLGGFSDTLGRSGGGTVAGGALLGILAFLVASTTTIIAARLFMSLGDRVKGAPPGTTVAKPDL
jgi:hypothetical protein